MTGDLDGAIGVEQAVEVVVHEIGDVAVGAAGDVVVSLRHARSPSKASRERERPEARCQDSLALMSCQLVFQVFAQGGEAVVHVERTVASVQSTISAMRA